MRAMPPALRAAALAAQTNAVLNEFLTITHPDLASPIYVVNNTQAIIRGGHTYLPFAFKVDLPTDKDGSIGNAKLTIDAVDLSIITAIRSISSRASVGIVIALAGSPDATPECNLGTFSWKNLIYNRTTVSGDLSYDDILDTLIPNDTFTPIYVPGVF